MGYVLIMLKLVTLITYFEHTLKKSCHRQGTTTGAISPENHSKS